MYCVSDLPKCFIIRFIKMLKNNIQAIFIRGHICEQGSCFFITETHMKLLFLISFQNLYFLVTFTTSVLHAKFPQQFRKCSCWKNIQQGKRSLEDRKMHLTMCPAAYSIIALKPGNGEQLKCYMAIHLTGIKSYHFFQTCAGQFVSAWHPATW